MITVLGGNLFQRSIIEKTALWALRELNLNRFRSLIICIQIKTLSDCDGYCEKLQDRSFEIGIHRNQTIRDFVMTTLHEMVHVRQYVRKDWSGDGEDEAYDLQAKMADKLWKENII